MHWQSLFCGRILPGVLFAAAIPFLGGCGRPVTAEEHSFVARDRSLRTSLYISSVVNGNAGERCWYFLESGKPIDLRFVQNYPALETLTPIGVSDQSVSRALERAIRNNLIALLAASAGATGACAGAFASATATVTALLTPGAQPISLWAFTLTVAQVAGCGFAGKRAVEGMWTAWVYNSIENHLHETDANTSPLGKSSDAIRALRTAVSEAKFFGTGGDCLKSVPQLVSK